MMWNGSHCKGGEGSKVEIWTQNSEEQSRRFSEEISSRLSRHYEIKISENVFEASLTMLYCLEASTA